MGLMWHKGGVGAFLLVALLIASTIGEGGRTSNFVRNDYLSLDMPIDSDVFRLPPGYNAPQQVFLLFFSIASFS